MNDIQTWRQGQFIRKKQYSNWSEDEVKGAEYTEARLVRPSETGNAICACNNPNDAKWIAERLNLAAKLEQLAYDFATGKSDGSELVKLVQSNI